MRAFFLLVLLAAALSGCSVLETTPAPKKAEPTPPKPRTRELGSLWSDDSRWNDVYADAPSRVVGDVVTVKLTELFKARILQKAEAPTVALHKKEEEKKEKEKDKDGKAPALQAALPAASGKAKEIEAPPVMRATIQEILPRGIYVISGQETVKVKEYEPTVKLTGRVRDRDLDGEDTVSSDAISSLDLQVKPSAVTP